MILGPFLDSAKARLYPFWCWCVTLPLSSAASWLLSSLHLCGRCRCVCFVLASPPLCGLLPPMMAGFSLVVFVSSGLPVAWIKMWSYLVNDVEQSVPSRIGEYEVDQVWHQTVVRHVHWYVQDVEEQERMLP